MEWSRDVDVGVTAVKGSCNRGDRGENVWLRWFQRRREMGLLCCRLKIERKLQGKDLFDRLREERGLSAGMLENGVGRRLVQVLAKGKERLWSARGGEQLQERKRVQGFFFIFKVFLFSFLFLKKLPPCEYFSPSFHMVGGSLIQKISTYAI